MAIGEQAGRLRRRLATARATYRVGGVQAIGRKLLPVLGYHRVVCFEATLSPPGPVPAADVPIELGFLHPEALDEFAVFRGGPRVEYERRLERGERCFIARFDGTIVCGYWIARDGVRLADVGHEIDVPADAVYVYDAFTASALRGKRVAPALSRELKNRLAAEGVERWVSYVLGGNDAGLRNVARGASRETARIAAFRLGPLPPVRAPYLPRRRPRHPRP